MMLALRVSLIDFSTLSPGANVVGGATKITSHYKKMFLRILNSKKTHLIFLLCITFPDVSSFRLEHLRPEQMAGLETVVVFSWVAQ